MKKKFLIASLVCVVVLAIYLQTRPLSVASKIDSAQSEVSTEEQSLIVPASLLMPTPESIPRGYNLTEFKIEDNGYWVDYVQTPVKTDTLFFKGYPITIHFHVRPLTEPQMHATKSEPQIDLGGGGDPIVITMGTLTFTDHGNLVTVEVLNDESLSTAYMKNFADKMIYSDGKIGLPTGYPVITNLPMQIPTNKTELKGFQQTTQSISSAGYYASYNLGGQVDCGRFDSNWSLCDAYSVSESRQFTYAEAISGLENFAHTYADDAKIRDFKFAGIEGKFFDTGCSEHVMEFNPSEIGKVFVWNDRGMPIVIQVNCIKDTSEQVFIELLDTLALEKR